jgi:hypothetical protein
MRKLSSVQVLCERGKAEELNMTFADPDYTMQAVIKPSSTIIVKAGWKSEVRAKGPYKITEYKPSFPGSSSPSIAITGMSIAATKMNLNQRAVSYIGKTAKEIFQEIATRYNLTLQWIVDDEDNIQFTDNKSMTQTRETDKRFLSRLVDKMGGYNWGVDGLTLFVSPPEYSTKDIPLNYRIKDKSILSFEPEIKVFVNGGHKKGKKQVAFLDFFNSDNPAFAELSEIRPEEDVERSEELEEQSRDYFNGSTGGGLFDKAKNILGLESDPAEVIKSRIPQPGQQAQPPATFEDAKTELYRLLEVGAGNTIPLPNITPKEQVKGDAQSATAQFADEANIQLKKAQRKLVVAGGTLVPTFPSWDWTAREAVILDGLSPICNKRFEVAKATLTYDNSKGLQTSLELKSHIPTAKKANKKDIDALTDQINNIARPVAEQPVKLRIHNPVTGDVRKFESLNPNESEPQRQDSKDYLDTKGVNTKRIKVKE